MLNGIDPIIIFNFSKLTPEAEAKLRTTPLTGTSTEQAKIPLTPIPVYLSEKITGLFIDSEEKFIDISTATETDTSGKTPSHYQKGVNSSVRINIQASSNSLGLVLLSALADIAFEKVTSKEYSISYLHKGIVVFNALLQSFTINQNANDDRFNITIELKKTSIETKPTTSPTTNLTKSTGELPARLGP